jgi:cyclopropane-fatty-acyl-phospholipid synthase
MRFRWIEKRVTQVFSNAGIVLDGREVWDIHLSNPDKFFTAVALRGHDGFADAYVKGYWQCGALDQCITLLLRSGAIDGLRFHPANVRLYLTDLLWNKQKLERAQSNVSRHYNLGAVFSVMLDQTKCYSCGHWANATDLEGAQVAKLDHICQKLGLRTGKSFCDIGCGWGGLLLHAAREYQCSTTGITLSSDQYNYIKGLDLDSLPEDSSLVVRLEDYRKLHGSFDRIASVGMFEHVGRRNYRKFMCIVDEHLNSRGLFLLHTIGSRYSCPTLHQTSIPLFANHLHQQAPY